MARTAMPQLKRGEITTGELACIVLLALSAKRVNKTSNLHCASVPARCLFVLPAD
jgi:hypothetical protein